MALTQVNPALLTGSSNTVTTIQSNGTTAITIDSSQAFGINVTPNAWGSGYSPIQGLGYSLYSGNTVQARLSANEYFSNTASTYRVNGLAALYQQSSGIHSWFTAPSGTAGNAITFTESMRIDSSGNLLVGTTNTTPAQSNVTGFSYRPGLQLEVSGIATQAAFFGRSNDGQVIRFFNAGASAGNISNTSTVTTYNGTSDYRLKDNIQPMTGGLQKVLALKPVTYIWKNDGRLGQGFIAHELQEIIPDAVQGEKDGVDENGNPEYQGIDPRMIVATLTAAIQELKAINDQQAETIAQLQADVVELKAK